MRTKSGSPPIQRFFFLRSPVRNHRRTSSVLVRLLPLRTMRRRVYTTEPTLTAARTLA